MRKLLSLRVPAEAKTSVHDRREVARLKLGIRGAVNLVFKHGLLRWPKLTSSKSVVRGGATMPSCSGQRARPLWTSEVHGQDKMEQGEEVHSQKRESVSYSTFRKENRCELF